MSKKNSKNDSLWNNSPVSAGQSSSQTESPEEMAKKANDKSARNKRSH